MKSMGRGMKSMGRRGDRAELQRTWMMVPVDGAMNRKRRRALGGAPARTKPLRKAAIAASFALGREGPAVDPETVALKG